MTYDLQCDCGAVVVRDIRAWDLAAVQAITEHLEQAHPGEPWSVTGLEYIQEVTN